MTREQLLARLATIEELLRLLEATRLTFNTLQKPESDIHEIRDHISAARPSRVSRRT
jgi:hypothetical protein